MSSPRVFPGTVTLPKRHFELIGNITVYHAAIEARIKSAIFTVLRIGPKRGRLAIRDQRADEQLGLLETLLEMACIPVPVKFNFKKLKTRLKDADACRNALCHGVWVKHPDYTTPVLQVAQGDWRAKPPTSNAKRAPRKIKPIGLPLAEIELVDEAFIIFTLLTEINLLVKEIESIVESSP